MLCLFIYYCILLYSRGQNRDKVLGIQQSEAQFY